MMPPFSKEPSVTAIRFPEEWIAGAATEGSLLTNYSCHEYDVLIG